MTYIFPLGHFHQGLQEQAVDAFQRVAVDVFMPAVQRVGARDEAGHGVEFLLLVEQAPGVLGFATQLLEGAPVHALQQVQRAAQGDIAHAAKDGIHAGVVAIRRTEQLARAFFLVVIEDVLDAENRHRLVAAVRQRHLAAHGECADDVPVALAHGGEAQRHRPDHAIAQTAGGKHGLIVGLVHETLVG
ncbi:hypothetical protein D9M68_371280 [compost metagenome]